VDAMTFATFASGGATPFRDGNCPVIGVVTVLSLGTMEPVPMYELVLRVLSFEALEVFVDTPIASANDWRVARSLRTYPTDTCYPNVCEVRWLGEMGNCPKPDLFRLLGYQHYTPDKG
jgi:hypothetical protein